MKTVIVGGVAAGASTGARLRRLDESAEIVVLERDHYVSFANCGLPYHIGGVIPDRDSLLLQTPESLGRALALEVRTGQDVVRIDRGAKEVVVRDLGAVGFAVGLFAPPLLAATAVGAVIGAGAGKLLHRRTASKLEEQAGATIPVGGAGLIVAYPHSAAAKVEPAVTRAIQKAVGEAEGHHVKALKGAIADAQQKMADSGA